MCYIVFISHSLHWRYIKIALQEYVIKEVSSCHLLIDMKYTLVKFLKYVIGSSLVYIVKII